MAPVILELPIDRVISGPQVRTEIDEESLAGLAHNLGEAGLLQPIGVVPAEDGRFELLWGSRRLAAARLAGWTTIPAIITERKLTLAETLERQLSENMIRHDLRPVEKARAIRRLMQESGVTAVEVAAKIGISPAQLSKLLPLLLLDEPLQEAVEKGEVAASTAYEIAKVADPELRSQLAAEAVTGRITREKVSSRVKQARGVQRTRKSRKRSVSRSVVLELGNGRTVVFSGPEMTVAALAVCAEELLDRIHDLESMDVELVEAVKRISGERT